MNSYTYPHTPHANSPSASAAITPAMLHGLGQSTPTHPSATPAMSPTQLMNRQNAMGRMGVPNMGMNMSQMGAMNMPANMGSINSANNMNNINLGMGIDQQSMNPSMLAGANPGMVNQNMLMNPGLSQQDLQKALAQRQAFAMHGMGAMPGMNGMSGISPMGSMNSMNGMSAMGNVGMNMGLSGMSMMNGGVTPAQYQQYMAQQQQQQQQNQSHSANAVSSPSVGSVTGSNPYPPNFSAAAMTRSQTPSQNAMGMNANFQTPQGQSQMHPPPRPSTAMSSSSSQTSHALPHAQQQHTPVRPPTSMSHHAQMGPPSQSVNNNQAQSSSQQQFNQPLPLSISRPGTAAGVGPTSAGASPSGPGSNQMQFQGQPQTPHTPQQQFSQQQQQFQQQQQQNQQQMRPPSRPPTAGSNHGTPGQTTGSSPGAARPMGSMGNVPTLNGMNGVNVNSMGQRYGPGGMLMGVGNMSNMAGMAGMSGVAGMNGMPMLNNSNNGIMAPPNMPRQAGFGSNTQPTPQTPMQQNTMGPQAAHQASPTPAPGMSRNSSVSDLTAIGPGVPGSGLGDPMHGGDSSGAMGGLNGMNMGGMGLGGIGMTQVQHMEDMQRRKAIAYAAYQQQQQAHRLQMGGSAPGGPTVDGLMPNHTNQNAVAAAAASAPGMMNMGAMGTPNAAQMQQQMHAHAHMQGTPTRPSPGVAVSGGGRVSVPPPGSAMSQVGGMGMGMGMGMMGSGPVPGTPVRSGSVSGQVLGTPSQIPGPSAAGTPAAASAGAAPAIAPPVSSSSSNNTNAPSTINAAAPSSGVGTSATSIAGAIAGLPPLNVHLNPATTHMELVPLSEATTRIPELSTKEIADMKTWMEADKAYETAYRGMVAKAKAELMGGGGPCGAHVRWWERDAVLEAAVARVRRKEKFALEYPHQTSSAGAHRDARRRGKRREGLRIPGKLRPAEANRAEQLVPIRLEFDVEHHKYRDTFVWNLNDPIVTPETFAQSIIDDYGLSSSYHSTITKSIQEQLSDFKAHTASATAAEDEGVPTRGVLNEKEVLWWTRWRRRLRNQNGYVHTRALLRTVQQEQEPAKKRRKCAAVVQEKGEDEPLGVEAFEMDEDKMCEEMRITIKLDITVGETKLDDQFEWDIENDDTTPEQFAEVYCSDLSIAGEFKTAIAHSIREQVSIYQKSLFLVGHPSDGSAVQDDDLRMSFLSPVGPAPRSADLALSYQPIINYLSEGELDRLDKEREKEANKRRKRNTRGRRGIALPDREPLKTQRTPAIGFPEIDPSTLAAVAAAAMPTSRRAAAAAASLTIANMVASENGTAVIQPVNTTPAAPVLPLSKVPKAKGSFKAPTLPQVVLKKRADVTQATASTVVDSASFEPPVEGDAPLPALSTTVSVNQENRAPRPVSARRQRELEKEAKEREYADGQRPNLIDGVWHCSNCGCPESIAIGRRKGPLGDKSQCGACGKYWHRHRRPRPVEYNTDAEYHSNLRYETDRAKANAKKRGGAAALRALNMQHEQAQTPTAAATPASVPDEQPTPQLPKHEVWVEIKSPRKGRQASNGNENEDEDVKENGYRNGKVDAPERAVSPASSVSSSSSERPLAQTIKQQSVTNGSTPAAAVNALNASAPPSTTTTPLPPKVELPEVAIPAETPQATQSEPASASIVATPAPDATPAPGQGSPPPPQRPQWTDEAISELKSRYPSDHFDLVLRRGFGGSGAAEWRVRCLDCPGKVYKPGPDETLSNFEVHLRNRGHRAKVNERTGQSGNGDATPSS